MRRAQVWDVQDAKGGFAYSQSRMTHLLRLISESLIVYIESQLKGVDLWSGAFQVNPVAFIGPLG